MTAPRRMKATKIEGGFSLRLIDSDDRDLGEALDAGIHHGETILVVMDDGRELGLFPAVAELLTSRVIEVTVTTELTATLPLPVLEQAVEPEKRVH